MEHEKTGGTAQRPMPNSSVHTDEIRTRVRTRNPLKVWWMVEVLDYRILLRKNLPDTKYMVQYEWLLCKNSETSAFRYKR